MVGHRAHLNKSTLSYLEHVRALRKQGLERTAYIYTYEYYIMYIGKVNLTPIQNCSRLPVTEKAILYIIYTHIVLNFRHFHL